MTLDNLFRQQHVKTPWALGLLVVFWFQALVPIQIHTQWQRSGEGRYIEVCTLSGVHKFTYDPDNTSVNGQPTAAMFFSNLLNHAPAIDLFLALSIILFIPISFQQVLPLVSTSLRTLRKYLSRAPPSFKLS